MLCRLTAAALLQKMTLKHRIIPYFIIERKRGGAEWRVKGVDLVCPLSGHIVYYCPVGRGDPTPPGKIKIIPLVVGASIARPCGLPVAWQCPCDCNGRHICRPYKLTRDFCVAAKPRAGHAPPLPCDHFYCRRFASCPAGLCCFAQKTARAGCAYTQNAKVCIYALTLHRYAGILAT